MSNLSVSNLQVRKIPFEFEGVKFNWNPAQPRFSTVINQISFWALGLERYFVKSMLDAEKVIKNPAVLEEARLFRLQEAQHSSCHRRHVNELIKQYPALQGTLESVIKDYDDLYEGNSLAFNLAYAGGLEATFTPAFKLIIDNRQLLFAEGDSRVASLNLWHFCEEVEHRSSAIMIYNEVIGSHSYRLSVFPKVLLHTLRSLKMIETEFLTHVPESDRFPKPLQPPLNAFQKVSAISKFKAIWGILAAQTPWHNPKYEPLPEWSEVWFKHWEQGDDMTHFYGKRAEGANQ